MTDADDQEDVAGEVSVRAGGTEHAMTELEEIDGQVFVDLDAPKPHVAVPSGVDVSYRDESLEADGGVPESRREIVMRGVGLGEDASNAALVLSVLLLVSSGVMLNPEPLYAILMAVSGIGAGYLGARSRWSDLSPIEAGADE